MKTYEQIIYHYESHLTGLGYTSGTIKLDTTNIKKFLTYLTERNLKDIREVNEKHLIEYVEYLKNKKSQYKRNISIATINRAICSIRGFFKYLATYEVILTNPIEETSLYIKSINRIKEIFSIDEINAFLDNIKDLRDKAIFELIYSSALRLGDVVNLKIEDVNLKERIITIKEGKGKKDRYLVFSNIAEIYLRIYIEKERIKELKKAPKQDRSYLFITKNGRLHNCYVQKKMKKYLNEADIPNKALSPHSIRHTTATHLLEAGCNIRYVAELLGHESLDTTVGHTHVLLENIKRVYKTYHPRENKLYEELTEEYLKEVEKLKQTVEKSAGK